MEAMEKRRADPDAFPGLITGLMQIEIEGERLTDREALNIMFLLLIAGLDTVTASLSCLVGWLARHPAERAALVADPSLLPTAIEEMLRFVSPVIHFRRTATQDTEIAGQPIAEGDKVVVYYVSANRDPDAFDDPDTFDVGRTPNEHVAFGVGPHFCLGAHLARQEIGAMFSLLLDRVPRLQLAGPVERMQSTFINGIKHLPVEVRD
jgi:cytochrome P450